MYGNHHDGSDVCVLDARDLDHYDGSDIRVMDVRDPRRSLSGVAEVVVSSGQAVVMLASSDASGAKDHRCVNSVSVRRKRFLLTRSDRELLTSSCGADRSA
jgi:hypothetical protein